MSDEKSFWRALKASPSDTAKLILADWYAEHGRADVEYALRWCVARKKWPAKSLGVAIWFTQGRLKRSYYTQRMATRTFSLAALPPILIDAIRNYRGSQAVATTSATVESAIKALARGLTRLRAVIEAAV